MKKDRHRQIFKGVVKSDKMDKTRVMEVPRSMPHYLYLKKTYRHTKLFVHDENNESHVGDTILAVSDRPLSKNKHFRLLKVVEKGIQQ